jgi:hypothetical protein
VSSSRSCHVLSRSVVSALLLATLSAEAFAEAITLDDLAGAAVEANIHRRQDMEQDGRAFSTQAHQHWRLDINTDKTIDMTVNTTIQGPRGTRKAPPSSGRFSLNEAREVRNRGGGQGVWSFADEALHFTRTFPSGAYRAHFAFTRGEGGMTCKVTEAFAREDGNKPITLESPVDGRRVTILDSKQEPSDCEIKPAKPQ